MGVQTPGSSWKGDPNHRQTEHGRFLTGCPEIKPAWQGALYARMTPSQSHPHTPRGEGDRTAPFSCHLISEISLLNVADSPISSPRPCHRISQPARPAWLSAPAARGRPFFSGCVVARRAALRTMRLIDDFFFFFFFFESQCSEILVRASVPLQLFPAVYSLLRADGARAPLFSSLPFLSPLLPPSSLPPPPPPPPHTLSPGSVIASERWVSVPMM